MTEVSSRTTRAQRMAMPLAREVVKDLAVEHGACIRAIQLRRTDLDELLTELDEEITNAGMRGKVAPAKPARRHRSTRRRQDAPDLPRRKVSPRTVGKTYTAPDGKTFRPSLFVTLTCPSYGRVDRDGAPADPGAYDYDRAARDALTFAALFDRFIQNLRRYLGQDVQYFAAIEPQRRLAPACPSRHPGHRGPRRAAPGAGRHLPPGLVAERERG